MKEPLKLSHLLSIAAVLLMAGVASASCGKCKSDPNHVMCSETLASADCLKASFVAEDGENKNADKPAVEPGTAAPDFTLKDINGKDVQLSKFKGKTVVLEWVNYDCPFVKAHYDTDANTMSNLAAKYADKDVVWLTINSTHTATAETNKEWAEKHQLKQAVLVDSDGKVGKLYGATNTPQMFVIDKTGKVVYVGAIDNAPLGKAPEEGLVNYVDTALAEVLAGKAVSTPKTKPYGCTVKYAAK